MKEVSATNFGLLIAYLLPGFISLWGVSLFSETVRGWLGTAPADAPTVGGFLYVTLASVGAGQAVSLLRWLLVDRVQHWTGVRHPQWDFARLQEKVAAFNVLVEIHYRYYQFYANSLVAIAFTYLVWRYREHIGGLVGTDLLMIMAALGLFAGARDTLRKYYTRGAKLLGTEDAAIRGIDPDS